MSPSSLAEAPVYGSFRSPTDDPETKAIMRRALVDNQFYAQTFHPELFDHHMTWMHQEIWKRYDDELAHKTVVCAPRGLAKTTDSLAYVCKCGVFRTRNLVYWVSQTEKSAEAWTENIKGEILQNPVIRSVFGNLKSKKFEDSDVTQSKRAWSMCDPKTGEPFMIVIPKGSGQQVRGINIRVGQRLVRPDLIIVDDPENSKEISNEENRKAFQKWLHGSLMRCVDTKRMYAWQYDNWLHAKEMASVYGKNFAMWRVIYNDTLKHEDAQIAHLLSEPTWKSCRLSICEIIERDKFNEPKFNVSLKESVRDRATKFFTDNPKEARFYACNIPDLIPDWQLWQDIQAARRAGTLNEFFNEMMCLPIATESASFGQSYFQYYDDRGSGIANDPNMLRVVIFDPARSGDPSAAYTAILAAAIDTANRRIYMRRLFNDHVASLAMYDKALEFCVASNSRMLAVDDTGLKEHLRQPLIDRASTMGLDVRFMWLKNLAARGAGDYGTGREAPKRARGAQIAPYYQAMQVWHDHSLRGSALEQQMLSYPKPGNWDALDCAGYIPQIMNELGIHFTAAPKPKSGQSPYPAFTDNFEDFQRAQDVIAGRWRRI